jgi:hypothetical protein
VLWNENGRFGVICNRVRVEGACFGDKDARLDVNALRRARDVCWFNMVLYILTEHMHACFGCKERRIRLEGEVKKEVEVSRTWVSRR